MNGNLIGSLIFIQIKKRKEKKGKSSYVYSKKKDISLVDILIQFLHYLKVNNKIIFLEKTTDMEERKKSR